MIARVWKGVVAHEHGDAYAEYMHPSRDGWVTHYEVDSALPGASG